ncbi:unnamed protein product [Vitrella brassicaformis CCMP3155]|uniref:Peptidase S74 domain-containing protein n=2 Tax=Vitrella brassicaformis TaxID=1169539 RepID=A0A0G4H794_VITBC|nr:unnamed protein product [Vitrella brassicaformis CCMP3155]|mmetsp:Transcript_2549/g.5790  ORF Transcript_2549/g.5790 Transcript_2549/m.5790 type:complete len:364 (+) Transcript_2549:67-1158(+)|eukprot:CEM39779.1 unnamed protein product [Vitrella brassicaformis CCMP3155]
MVFSRLAFVAVVFLAIPAPPCAADCDADEFEDDDGCERIIAGNPELFQDGTGDVTAERYVKANTAVLSDGTVVASDNVRSSRNIIAQGTIEAGNPSEFTENDGDVKAETDVEADRSVRAGIDVIAEDDVIARNNVIAGSGSDFDGEVIGDSIRTGQPSEREVRRGDIGATADLQADDTCYCPQAVTRRAFAHSFEVRGNDSDRPSTPMAEWGDRNRSMAYEAFRQLRVRTGGDARLGLAAKEVQRLFPMAVRTLLPDDDGDDDAESEAEKNGEMTIDLTQLLYTQMAVIQDLITEKEDLRKTTGGLTKRLDQLAKANKGLMKANEAMMGRMARLEQGSSKSESNEPSGPIEALQKMAKGLLAP